MAAFRTRVIAVAAANRHSAALTAGGEVWTWGSNAHGQLGYGTSDSGSNPNPRLVEALKVWLCCVVLIFPIFAVSKHVLQGRLCCWTECWVCCMPGQGWGRL